jgi:hypothetical protein
MFWTFRTLTILLVVSISYAIISMNISVLRAYDATSATCFLGTECAIILLLSSSTVKLQRVLVLLIVLILFSLARKVQRLHDIQQLLLRSVEDYTATQSTLHDRCMQDKQD